MLESDTLSLTPEEKEAIVDSLQHLSLHYEEVIDSGKLEGDSLARTKSLLAHCEAAYKKISYEFRVYPYNTEARRRKYPNR